MSSDIDRAHALIDANQHEAGMRVLSVHMARHPDDPVALCIAAQSLLGTERHVDALAAAQRASTLRPGSEWPVRLIALAQIRLQQPVEAVRSAEHAVALAPNVWETHYMLALARSSTQYMNEAALAAIVVARQLNPNEPSIHRLAGKINDNLSRRKEAVACFTRALQIDPNDAIARHELGRLDFNRGALAAAADSFGNAVALDPRLHVGVQNLDRILVKVLRLYVLFLLPTTLLAPVVPPPFLGPTLVTGFIVVSVTLLLRKGGRRLRQFVRALPRRLPWLVAAYGLAAAAVVLIWVRAIAPVEMFVWTVVGIICLIVALMCAIGAAPE
jgi:tetratricopeptide (TPR) repeat protein